MSDVSSVKSNDYIKLNPRTELNHHTWYGRLWKIAAIASLVAYIALATLATIVIGLTAPIYIPISTLTIFLLADCVINKIYTPLNQNAKYHLKLAKINQGIVDQLNKFDEDERKNYLKARYKYFKQVTERCTKKIEHYQEAALKEKVDNRPALYKAGLWLDKKLRAISTAAYCKALMKDEDIKAPKIRGVDFSYRAYEKRFLARKDFLELKDGTTLSARQIETLDIKGVAQRIYNSR